MERKETVLLDFLGSLGAILTTIAAVVFFGQRASNVGKGVLYLLGMVIVVLSVPGIAPRRWLRQLRRHPISGTALRLPSGSLPRLRLIPLCGGDAAAGKPLTIGDNIEGYIAASEFQIGDEAFTLQVIQGVGEEPHINIGNVNFAVKVKGNSMEPIIQNGEYVLVRRHADVDSGTISVVRFRKDVSSEESEVTVKRYYREQDHMLLRPENEDAKWLVIVGKEEDENTMKGRYQEQLRAGKLEIFVDPDAQIEGKVVGILKRKEA
jgi:SOS-response transcriptional repressor LexA